MNGRQRTGQRSGGPTHSGFTQAFASSPPVPLETCSSSSHFPTLGVKPKGPTGGTPRVPFFEHEGFRPNLYFHSLPGFPFHSLTHYGRGVRLSGHCTQVPGAAGHEAAAARDRAVSRGLGALTRRGLRGRTCAPQARLDLDAGVLLLHGARQLQVGRLKAAGFTMGRPTTPGFAWVSGYGPPVDPPSSGRRRSPILHHNADPAARLDLPAMGRCGHRPHVPAHRCRPRSRRCFRVLRDAAGT